MKRSILWIQLMLLIFTLTACGKSSGLQEASGVETGKGADDGNTLVYGSGDYTRINPAMDEHGEINLLLFNGLTAHDGENGILPGLAREWTFDEAACAYTFYLEEEEDKGGGGGLGRLGGSWAGSGGLHG